MKAEVFHNGKCVARFSLRFEGATLALADMKSATSDPVDTELVYRCVGHVSKSYFATFRRDRRYIVDEATVVEMDWTQPTT